MVAIKITPTTAPTAVQITPESTESNSKEMDYTKIINEVIIIQQHHEGGALLYFTDN